MLSLDVICDSSSFFNISRFCSGTGLQKALDTVAKEKDCEDLKLWRPAIINHLYWTASSTPNGDSDKMEAKWQSMLNHVQDIHEHSYPSFPQCAHPPLEGEGRDKQWLEPGTIECTIGVRGHIFILLVKDLRV